MLDEPRQQCGDGERVTPDAALSDAAVSKTARSNAATSNAATSDAVKPLLPPDFFAKCGRVPSREEDRRRFARLYYRVRTLALLQGSLPAFPRELEATTVYLADVSRGGFGFICDRQLFPREQIEVEIPEMGVKRLMVKRCKRLAVGSYQIGCELVSE
jgi:hypothetical protein